MKKSPQIQNGILSIKILEMCVFHHVTTWVLESTVHHLKIVCKGLLWHN